MFVTVEELIKILGTLTEPSDLIMFDEVIFDNEYNKVEIKGWRMSNLRSSLIQAAIHNQAMFNKENN